MKNQVNSALNILRRKQVEARTGLSRSTIYAHMRTGDFPACIRLGAKSVGWIEGEINQWLVAQIENSRKAA
ncbi:AlpA family phage regulatory protein [Dechloromonas sp. TW-R-39-2]|uniref:helix-turn-helix transcriptional regulator n=1 Tax=Dechloromonas sp. TW-R-39-2 TaxID=2654218 RepID=UPI00193E7A28|nr:AlpA family transcriptional regulator [Dechloromonas sp. TW-R-39-2]QRM20670.1 AlpA family phage regulatory protein [Dechloromonas sp. TW-R-39-2]